jgi:hypothetical protein
MPMSERRVETLAWVLIYGGLLALSLGLFVREGGDAIGWLLVAGGALVALAGIALIVVRSRMGTETEPNPKPKGPR